jgi:oligopeptide/dipeptide ABC transporter ATP-binding protein
MTNGVDVRNGGLSVRNLVKHFALGGLPWSNANILQAVDGISFDIAPHETLSLVGESGCGKTTTAKLVLRLEKPTSGSVTFRNQDVHKLKRAGLRQYRAAVQAVFQDPWSSLNPRMRARDIISEPLRVNLHLGKKEREERVGELLETVGLTRAMASNYPHEFSGGMRQRVAVARALSLSPSLIVLDEPVSALDVSIRAQIMNILKDLQIKHGMAYLLIAHDLATVRYLSHRVAVMYLGRIVEDAASEDLFRDPIHPYTKALLSAALPALPGDKSEQIILRGDVPSPVNPPSGCRFHPRCWLRQELGDPERCAVESPALREVLPGHATACHFAEELLSGRRPQGTAPSRGSSTGDAVVEKASGLGSLSPEP